MGRTKITGADISTHRVLTAVGTEATDGQARGDVFDMVNSAMPLCPVSRTDGAKQLDPQMYSSPDWSTGPQRDVDFTYERLVEAVRQLERNEHAGKGLYEQTVCRVDPAPYWSDVPVFHRHIPDHVHPSAEGIAMFERSRTAKTLSPRDASRRAIDETVRGLRDQPFAAAIQAVLVSACTEGKAGERILSRADIDSMVAACRAWEDCRGKVAPGRRTLTPEQAAKCWEAATKVGLWLGGSGEVYERARSM